MSNYVSAIIDPVTRDILFERSNVSSVELDGGLWTIKFKMVENFGQNSRSSLSATAYTITVNYSQNNPELYEDGYTDYIYAVDPTDEVDGLGNKYVSFLWTPPREAYAKQGWLYFNVRIRNKSSGGVMSTKTKKLRVSPVVVGGDNPSLTPSQSTKIDELLDEVAAKIDIPTQEILDEIDSYKDDVDTYREEVKALQEEAEKAVTDSILYKPMGSISFEDLPTPTASIYRYVYNIEDPFTTDNSFVDGAGTSYPAGVNVICVQDENGNYRWDVLTTTAPEYDMLSAEDIRQMWENTPEKVTDSAECLVSIANGAIPYNIIRRRGDLVQFSLGINLSSGLDSWTWTEIGKVPDAFVPETGYIGVGMVSNAVVLVRIGTNGIIEIQSPGGSSNTAFRFGASWICTYKEGD